MSRLTSIFQIVLFLNTGAGNELFSVTAQTSVAGGPEFRVQSPGSVRESGVRPEFSFDPAFGRRPARTASGLLRTDSGPWTQDSGLTWSRQSPVGSTPEARGAWLARQMEDRDTGRDARIDMRMKLFDRQGRVRERALSLSSMRGGAGRPVPGDRSLVRFTYPNDIKGTAFLVWKQADADDERFLYLPSMGRVRRIAGSESQESFVGSDFTYEDIGGREIENYTYRMIEPGIASWTAPDGSRHPVYQLESRSRDTGAKYPRIVSLVRKDNFVVVHAQIFNRRDELQKTFDAVRVDKVEGYWTVLEMRMSDGPQRTRTELVLEKVDYNVGLKPDDFSRRELERGGRP